MSYTSTILDWKLWIYYNKSIKGISGDSGFGISVLVFGFTTRYNSSNMICPIKGVDKNAKDNLFNPFARD